MTSQCRTVFCCGAAFLLLLGCAFVLKPGAVWITDNGNKYIMIRNFAKGEGTVIKHVFPELFPTGGFHFIKVPGGAVSFYPEYLSFITVPFYKLFGERGTLFFPLLATLLLLFMAWYFWHIPPPLLLLSTPLFFYSLLLWEMTPSVCLCLGALLLAEKRRFLLSGTLLGISLIMREEAYFLGGAMGAALLCCGKWQEALKFGAGFLGAALPLWGFQWSVHGHFLGNHGKYYYLNNNAGFSLFTQLKAFFFNCYHHLFRFDGWANSHFNYLVWSTLLPLAAGAAPAFKKWLTFKYTALIIYLGAMCLLIPGVWFQSNTIYAASCLTGLLTATPLTAGFLVNWNGFLHCRRFKLPALGVIFYIVGVPPLMTASDVGLVWGARHFLIILPLLFWLSFRGFRLMGIPKFKGCFNAKQLLPCGAVLLSVTIQLYGIFALFRVSGESHAIEQRLLGASEKIIVTDVFYLPEQMPRLFFEKDVVQVISKEDITLLRQFLKEHKAARFTLLLSPRFRRMDDAVLKKLLTAFPLLSQPERLTGKGGFPDLFRGTCAVPTSK